MQLSSRTAPKPNGFSSLSAIGQIGIPPLEQAEVDSSSPQTIDQPGPKAFTFGGVLPSVVC